MSAKTKNITEQLGPYSFTQPDSGQRLTTDTLCLIDFMLPLSDDDIIIDLGTGAGVIPMMLAWKSPVAQIVGVEIDEQAAALAQKNIEANNLEKRITIINNDLRDTRGLFSDGPVPLL